MQTSVPTSVDFAAMPIGQVLVRFPGGEQRIERCPCCGRPGKPRLTGLAARSWVHEQVGVVPTKVCRVGV